MTVLGRTNDNAVQTSRPQHSAGAWKPLTRLNWGSRTNCWPATASVTLCSAAPTAKLTPGILDFTSPVVYHDRAMKISVSILSSDFTRFGEQIAECEAGGADWIHLDVMDGHFVPNISFGPVIVEAARRATHLPLDVHLMIEEPDRYLAAFAQAGADRMTVHVEACRHLHRTVQQIRQLGKSVGVAINPATPAGTVSEILNDVD